MRERSRLRPSMRSPCPRLRASSLPRTMAGFAGNFPLDSTISSSAPVVFFRMSRNFRAAIFPSRRFFRSRHAQVSARVAHLHRQRWGWRPSRAWELRANEPRPRWHRINRLRWARLTGGDRGLCFRQPRFDIIEDLGVCLPARSGRRASVLDHGARFFEPGVQDAVYGV